VSKPVATPVSLLRRLQAARETQSWNRFVRLYTPLIYGWARGQRVGREDAADIVQEVFAVLVRKLPTFQYDENGGFGRWLRTITVNKCRDHLRRQASRPAQTNIDPAPEDMDSVAQFTEEEYRRRLARLALEIMREEFEPKTWKACWEHVVSGRPAKEIAQDLGMSVGAVYVAKSRVLRRLREELDGLWE
jgi:RNA polymerase sigma-70 factor (ECF subfamily)